MNMVMHGDGSANISHANSLRSPDQWIGTAQENIGLGEFDIVVANPPFGTKAVIDDTDILDQFELTNFGASSPRNSLPPEQLFVERCLDFLKPGGYMGIVLPDSILSNPGLEWLREWLLERVVVIASVDLPTETFEPHTGTQTSVLLVQNRDTTHDGSDDYEIFMAMPENVGHDRRGNPVFKSTPEGEVAVDEDGIPVPDDDLPSVVEAFEEWAQGRGMV